MIISLRYPWRAGFAIACGSYKKAPVLRTGALGGMNINALWFY
jgi:hypothetical protein